jgi:hypothetical protein
MQPLKPGLLALALAAGLLPAPLAGQSPTRPAADSLDDGPHVYWAGDDRAIVFHLCGGNISAVRFEVPDTLAFNGLCADSGLTYRVTAAAPAPARHTWDEVPRILAISDVHGQYDAMVTFLTEAGVIDAAGRWAFGDGHLVVAGDMVDRGPQVTECLWFLHGLEREAEAAGGRVHVLLGNHELMVMQHDVRYVHSRYTNGIVRQLGVRYTDLFGPEMELGRWLRSKPLVVKLNDILFVHGGLAPALAGKGLDIEALNTIGRESLDLSSVALAFSEVPGLLVGSSGPLWYRGYLRGGSGGDSTISSAELDGVLRFYGATAVVVGHTSTGRIARLHDGRVFAIDPAVATRGVIQGLLWENGTFSVVTPGGAVEPFN